MTSPSVLAIRMAVEARDAFVADPKNGPDTVRANRQRLRTAYDALSARQQLYAEPYIRIADLMISSGRNPYDWIYNLSLIGNMAGTKWDWQISASAA